MNIKTLLRELPGPRLLHWDVDIVPKPRFWNRGAMTVSLEAQPASRVTGVGKDSIPTYLNPPNTGVIPAFEHFHFVGLRYVGVWDIED